MGGCGCVGGWVDQWVNGWGQVATKNLINLDLIDHNSILFEDL